MGDWRVTAGYVFVAARVEASEPAMLLDGLRPAQTPRHSLFGSIGWGRRSGVSANIAVRYNGSRECDAWWSGRWDSRPMGKAPIKGNGPRR
jgi:hypothetical protein